jgi:hypothetical protein
MAPPAYRHYLAEIGNAGDWLSIRITGAPPAAAAPKFDNNIVIEYVCESVATQAVFRASWNLAELRYLVEEFDAEPDRIVAICQRIPDLIRTEATSISIGWKMAHDDGRTSTPHLRLPIVRAASRRGGRSAGRKSRTQLGLCQHSAK